MSERRSRTFAVATLGCKLNQYETECVRESLEKAGWVFRRFEEGAEFYIINSCTVTGKTDARTRNLVRRARRVSPGAFIIATGCLAETEPESLERLDEVDLVVGNAGKASLHLVMERIVEAGDDADIRETVDRSAGLEPVFITRFHGHSRAFVKIQEGCDASCSYCIIPRARGPHRSVGQAAVLEQVRLLADGGYGEIVLTGIHIGRYGTDLPEQTDLARLLRRLLDRVPCVRFRLSSIEPTEVTPDLLDIVAGSDRIASHLHIPLQSGDDRILEAMKRTYDTGRFRRGIEAIKERNASIAVGTDVIVGFPGETDESFRRTYAFLSDLPVDYFHVFGYSRRPGTPAASMPGQVDPAIRKSRSGKLIRLGGRKRLSFMRERVGTVESALVQGPAHRFSRFARAVTGNYVEISVPRDRGRIGALAPVLVTHYSRGRLYGRILGGQAEAGIGGKERRR
ncbi:MAG: tRNA (N(6)-L-threonylcarbamoyladenosine(37)-C(2))-methylthiotransferase MtaB [Candidatus Krumholzibacteriota bacterium]|nr:tRNA (N(6)-L-threonylcarbamoyladenosine(37)-C(2))-methylthiotransferase MtaB [Candidatus Krumholzibacteriota bacterium]